MRGRPMTRFSLIIELQNNLHDLIDADIQICDLTAQDVLQHANFIKIIPKQRDKQLEA